MLTPGTAADFSGACAIHDMCYGRADDRGRVKSDYIDCNNIFAENMVKVCRNVYSVVDPRRRPCLQVAQDYFYGVVIFNASQWPGYFDSEY